MTEQEAYEAIKEVPLGSKLQLIKRNGDVIEVRLVSHEVRGTEKRDYGNLVVPALPPALTVQGGTRFGSYRIEVEDLVNIAWIAG